jgi:opacity protein-like surface antigen
VGYNWATPYNIIYGVEGDIGFMDLTDQFSKLGPLWGTLRGRVGYAIGSLLPYVTYGVAIVETDETAFGIGDSRDIDTGWVAGAGVEMAMSELTSVKLEYLHMDFSQSNRNSFIFEDKADLIRIGMNMRF